VAHAQHLNVVHTEVGSAHEAHVQHPAIGYSVSSSPLPGGALSDKVPAAAGAAPTLTSVLAALSGDDVQVADPDLDQELSRMLGDRAEDIALAQQIRHRELGRTAGWAGPHGDGDPRVTRPITVRYVAGRTDRRALVIGGVHGSEVQGIEIAQQLLKDLTSKHSQPAMSAIIVPVVFPDNAAYRDREGVGAPTNRNFPDPSHDLAASGGADARGRPIRRENIMLLQLIERFSPERIISIHGTSDPAMAGVSYDPRMPAAVEETSAKAWNRNPDFEDERLCLRAAALIEARTTQGAVKGPSRVGLAHPSVAGNYKGRSEQPNVARWAGSVDGGVSLGRYASHRGLSIFTVEPPENKTRSEYTGAARQSRDVEIKAYAEAVRTVLLGG
jgi:Succinylglutamate desuccinylase / Aspartoacylase family